MMRRVCVVCIEQGVFVQAATHVLHGEDGQRNPAQEGQLLRHPLELFACGAHAAKWDGPKTPLDVWLDQLVVFWAIGDIIYARHVELVQAAEAVRRLQGWRL